MKKVNLKRELKTLYGTSSRNGFVLVDVPAMDFLMVDGVGNPNTAQSYADAIAALYALSYRLKFMVKKGPMAIDYGVMPLESLWWTDNAADFSTKDKDAWNWRAMIMQPEWIDREIVETARSETEKKKDLPALAKLHFGTFHEGRAAQCLHIGPYSEEAETIQGLHQFIVQTGHGLRGKHHEIYLSDARRTAPEKLKTIIRQPMQ